MRVVIGPTGPPPVRAPGERARPVARTSGWLIFIGLAVGLHAALIVPFIAGREGPDGISSTGHAPAARESIMVVDSSALARPTTRASSETPRFDIPETAIEPAQRAGRGAALLPFDVQPIPPLARPTKKAATPQKTDSPAPTKTAAVRRTRVARASPAEPPPPPFDPPPMMPGPAMTEIFPPPPPSPPPPPPPRYSSRRFWWGVWCGAYVACD